MIQPDKGSGFTADQEGVAKSTKALNHEEHEGHKGKAILRALRGSLLFRAFCDALSSRKLSRES